MGMSDMPKALETRAEFTARDLNRHLAKVLDACDRLGSVRVRTRKGQVYELRAEPSPAPAGDDGGIPDFLARHKALGLPKMSKKQSALLDKLIAGE